MVLIPAVSESVTSITLLGTSTQRMGWNELFFAYRRAARIATRCFASASDWRSSFPFVFNEYAHVIGL